MAVSQDFMDFVVDQLSDMEGVTSRKMFGGAGFFRESYMFALITNEDKLFLKVDDGNRARFEEAGCGPFVPPFKRTMQMPYYEVPPEVLEDRVSLTEWAEESFQVALRSKKGKKK
jgi:DNA transformation protein